MRTRNVLTVAGLALLLAGSVCGPAWATAVSVTEAALENQNTTDNTVDIKFNLSVNNAWKDSVSEWGAWVFFRYTTTCGTSDDTKPVILASTGTLPTGFSAGTSSYPLTIWVPANAVGGIVKLASAVSGAVNLSATGVKFRWNYGQDGIADDDVMIDKTALFGYAIEMVRIPEAGFIAGDGVATSGFISNTSLGWNITGNAGFTTASAASGAYYYTTDSTADDDATGAVFNVSSAYPKGYKTIWCMLTEISQGLYVDFVNSIKRAHQDTRLQTDISADAPAGGNVFVMSNATSRTLRNDVQVAASDNGTSPTQAIVTVGADWKNKACNYLTWSDLCAFLDWAGLRPMTELEYEKICRGPLDPVANEYAWGSTTLDLMVDVTGTGDSEAKSAAGDNGYWNNPTLNDGTTGPVRVGIMATSSTTTRAAAGAGYYGVLDMSGGLWKHVVTVGNAAGRGFDGAQGNGYLNTNGDADVASWPGFDGTGVTGAGGSGFRGSAFDETVNGYAQVSDRTFAGDTDNTYRGDTGGRGVLTEE